MDMFKLLFIILTVLFLMWLPMLVNADDPHRDSDVDINITNKYNLNIKGLTAIHAGNQIHPSENISGIQLGLGIAHKKNTTGYAIGAAFNFKGLGLVNGSIAKETGDDYFVGAGLNLSIRP